MRVTPRSNKIKKKKEAQKVLFFFFRGLPCKGSLLVLLFYTDMDTLIMDLFLRTVFDVEIQKEFQIFFKMSISLEIEVLK